MRAGRKTLQLSIGCPQCLSAGEFPGEEEGEVRPIAPKEGGAWREAGGAGRVGRREARTGRVLVAPLPEGRVLGTRGPSLIVGRPSTV